MDGTAKKYPPTRNRKFYRLEFHRTNHHLREAVDPSKAFPVSMVFGEYINKDDCNWGFHSSPMPYVSRWKEYMDTIRILTIRSDREEKKVSYLTKLSTANIFLWKFTGIVQTFPVHWTNIIRAITTQSKRIVCVCVCVNMVHTHTSRLHKLLCTWPSIQILHWWTLDSSTYWRR